MSIESRRELERTRAKLKSLEKHWRTSNNSPLRIVAPTNGLCGP